MQLHTLKGYEQEAGGVYALQKVPEEYFELPDRKVKESKSMKLTKARLKQIIKEELEATMREETLPSFEDFNEFVQSGGNRGSDAVKAYAQGILDNPPEGIPLDSMAGEVKLSVIQAQYMLDSPGTSPELKEMANTILRMARNLPAGS